MLDHRKFNKITAFLFDVDGVLTDGSVLITENGEFLRKMNVRDGQAMKIALKKGYKIFIVTKGNSKGVRERLKNLGVTKIHDELKDKAPIIDEIFSAHQLHPEETIYMGDDVPDLIAKNRVGIFASPNNAMPDILQNADYISRFNGGEGCVREIIERTLRIQDNWIL